MKKSRILLLVLPALTLFLEILPYGAVLNFFNPEGEPWRQTYSYFSMVPFGYANFGPLLTALLTCGAAIVLALYSVSGRKGFLQTGKGILWVATVLPLTPLVFGLSFYSLVGGLISITLAAQLVLLYCLKQK